MSHSVTLCFHGGTHTVALLTRAVRLKELVENHLQSTVAHFQELLVEHKMRKGHYIPSTQLREVYKQLNSAKNFEHPSKTELAKLRDGDQLLMPLEARTQLKTMRHLYLQEIEEYFLRNWRVKIRSASEVALRFSSLPMSLEKVVFIRNRGGKQLYDDARLRKFIMATRDLLKNLDSIEVLATIPSKFDIGVRENLRKLNKEIAKDVEEVQAQRDQRKTAEEALKKTEKDTTACWLGYHWSLQILSDKQAFKEGCALL